MLKQLTKKPFAAAVTLTAAMTALVGASASHAASDEWHFGIGSGLSSLSLDGDVGFATEDGGVIADVDLDNGDTMDMFESAFGFAAFATRGPWKINVSYATLTLEDDNSDYDVEWDKAQAQVDVAYQFAVTGNHHWTVVGGVRMIDHEWEFKDKATREKAKPDDDWTDVVIGVGHMVPITEGWFWTNRVDYGFGDSEGSLMLRTAVNWKPFDNWVFNGNMSYFDAEYGDKDDINKSDFYYYDVDETVIGLGFAYVW